MISYCTNIHPGESWNEVFANLEKHVPDVRSAVSSDRPFPIGLRLSFAASSELDRDAAFWFREWCELNSFFVPTINGFPYGNFHAGAAGAVKEQVYLPDWRSSARVDYTIRLADLLNIWLPDGIRGSISTVPVGFSNHIREDDLGIVRRNLHSVLEHLDRLRQKSGKEIILSLEPEPGCFLEKTADVAAFFERMKFSAALKAGLGVCFDCCHQAVEFENPSESLELLAETNIRIGKIQISSALRLKDPDRATLEKFCEPCYLHQVVVRDEEGVVRRYADLPEALQRHRSGRGDEWRIHFHVPIFADRMEGYDTTRFFIEEALPLIDQNMLLEVETYTWEVLPPKLRMETATKSIIREIQWLKEKRNETHGRSECGGADPRSHRG